MGSSLTNLIDQAWKDWLCALDLVPVERYAETGVCGPWSVKDLVGHMALWDKEVLTDIQRWLLGLPFQSNDWQTMNDDDHAAKANSPFDLLRVEMYSAHQIVRDVLAGMSDDLPNEMLERIAVDTWDHYPEHTGHILTWLQST